MNFLKVKQALYFKGLKSAVNSSNKTKSNKARNGVINKHLIFQSTK